MKRVIVVKPSPSVSVPWIENIFKILRSNKVEGSKVKLAFIYKALTALKTEIGKITDGIKASLLKEIKKTGPIVFSFQGKKMKANVEKTTSRYIDPKLFMKQAGEKAFWECASIPIGKAKEAVGDVIVDKCLREEPSSDSLRITEV